ncbi:MAG: molybdate ABC transporter permease subunit [Myxococcota bacterium]
MRLGSSRQRDGASALTLALAVLGVAFFVLPMVALGFGASWSRLWDLGASPRVRSAFAISAIASLGATGLAALLGLPIAWVLARTRLPGRPVVRALVTAPMVMPPVVAGAGLLAAFGPLGLVGAPLRAFGVVLPLTPLAAILAATFVATPFLIATVETALVRSDSGLEDAAATLGASRIRIALTVLLPQIAPALAAGLALCWARALGEFGATITFAGNLPGRTQTVPLALYQTLQTDPQAGYLVALALLMLSLGGLTLARWRVGE